MTERVGLSFSTLANWLYTGELFPTAETLTAALTAAANGLGRPAVTFSGNFGTTLSDPFGWNVNAGGQAIWNWHTNSFDFYPNAGIAVPAGSGSRVTSGFNFGGAIVYDLSWDRPEAYEGMFHEFTATANPGGIGGYLNYAVPPDDTILSIGDGPWSVGAGVNFGTPGTSVSYGSNWYWQVETFRREVAHIREQHAKLRERLRAE